MIRNVTVLDAMQLPSPWKEKACALIAERTELLGAAHVGFNLVLCPMQQRAITRIARIDEELAELIERANNGSLRRWGTATPEGLLRSWR